MLRSLRIIGTTAIPDEDNRQLDIELAIDVYGEYWIRRMPGLLVRDDPFRLVDKKSEFKEFECDTSFEGEDGDE